MEEFDNVKQQNNNSQQPTDHDLMVDEVYKDDVELLYLDCCFGELLKR